MPVPTWASPPSTFAPGEGLEIFYRVGGFGSNLTKALGVLWVRLGFLAALGLAAATFLSFPVACLFCFLMFFAAVGSEYLSESLSSYASIPRDEVGWWDRISAHRRASSSAFWARASFIKLSNW